jgi:hypothetical protein
LRYHSQDYSFGSFSLVRGKELWRLTNASEDGNGFETITGPAKGIELSKDRGLSERAEIVRSEGANSGTDAPSELRFHEASSAGLEKAAMPEAKALIARIALLLRRLLHGEEANPSLFECVESAVHFIHVNGGGDALNEERLKTLESLTVIRIMHRLGYVGDAADLNGSVASLELSTVSLDELKGKRTSMNIHINKALKESHL